MRTVEWRDEAVWVIDQTQLPHTIEVRELRDVEAVAEAIRTLRVRGAPAIGVTAAFGVALAARLVPSSDFEAFAASVRAAAELLRATRPTAVNLMWALDRMLQTLERGPRDPSVAGDRLLAEAQRIADEDTDTCRRIGETGATLIPRQANVLTHCNTGALATVAHGTALGVITTAHAQGKRVHVYVDETRPVLQGARLTAWELLQAGIPSTLITDSMAGHLMATGKVDVVIVGADRITRNGDTANKIGTYSLAVLARAHGIPFYVAAPLSTVDFGRDSGDEIPIEERHPDEITTIAGQRIAPPGIAVYNPAFDVTPARLITAIVTERGVAYPSAASPDSQHLSFEKSLAVLRQLEAAGATEERPREESTTHA